MASKKQVAEVIKVIDARFPDMGAHPLNWDDHRGWMVALESGSAIEVSVSFVGDDSGDLPGDIFIEPVNDMVLAVYRI